MSTAGKNRKRTPEERQADYQKSELKRERQKAAWIAKTLAGAKREEERRSREQARKHQGTREEIEQRAAEYEAHPIGTILTRARTGVLVQDDEKKVHWCRIAGKGTLAKVPVPGDRVRYTPQTDTSDGWLKGIEERSSLYQRYVFGKIKEVAANMDRILILATPYDPLVSPRLVDRMIVGAEVGGLEPIVVINKLDLFKEEEIEEYCRRWVRAGYRVIKVSAETGEGLPLLFEELKGHTTLLAGASGVGKSTLLNRLITDLELDTAAVSEATGRGVHTTTATRLYPVPGGGVVADTPGVKEFYPVIEEPSDLRYYFPEFDEPSELCAFDDCLHLEESEGCEVVDAVERDEIDADRYDSYLLIYQTLLVGPARGRALTQG